MKSIQMFDYEKAVQIINWFARKNGGEIRKLRLMRLIYLADWEHLRQCGCFLCGGTYIVTQNGPVHLEIKGIINRTYYSSEKEIEYRDKFIEKDNHTVRSKSKVDYIQFSKANIAILEKVWRIFGKYNARKLYKIICLLPTWKAKSGSLRIEDYFRILDKDSRQKLRKLGVPVEELVKDEVFLEIIKEMVMDKEGLK